VLDEDIEYHSLRAMQELDRGLIARSIAAARAHLQLSSLHLQRMRDLGGGTRSKRPPLTVC
jgi:hypothetical protein